MSTYAIKWLKDKLGTRFFPVTHINAVRDDTGTSLASMLEAKQDTLVSGTNIKTVNNNSLVGSGNVSIATGDTNVIETVKVNNSALTPDANKAVNITAVTTFNGSSGAVTYTAPVSSVNGQTGAVSIATGDTNVIETIKVNNTALTPDASKAVNISAVTSFNGSTGAVTYTAPVTSVNGETGAVTLSIPSEVTESTVSGWGFTKNAGTITGITMNGASKGTSGVVDLGTVITEHQDISGKADKSTTTTAGTYTSVTVNASGIVTGGTNPTTLAGYGITDAASSSDLANYLPLAGGTMSGTIKLPAGTGIEYSTGAGLLAYHPTNWGGTTNTQWCVGSLDSQGVIRSSNANLLHYNDGDGQSYAILDAKNYSSYALPLTGGTLTGDVVTTGEIMLYNNKYIRAKNTNDTNLNVLGIDTNNNLLVGYGNTASPTYIYGNSVRLLYGASRTIGITLDASGNTIFGSHIYLANNKYLYIGDGSGNNRNALYCSTAGNMFFGYDIAAAGKSTYIDGNVIYFRYGTAHGTAAIINSSGNVGIGTTSPSQKLHVNGVVKCTSVDTSSDERMKNKVGDITIKVEDIANAPNVTFKWKDGEDTDNIHGGTYAQYWEKITPYYVHGDEEKSMDYASLSLSCAIELAKEVVQLKEENAQLKREIAEIKEMLKKVL